MTDEQYQAHIEEVKRIQSEMAQSVSLGSFTLSSSERAALSALPDNIVQAIDDIHGKYQADSAFDIRGELVAKAVAQLITHLSQIERGIKLGYEAGTQIVEGFNGNK